MHRHYAEPIFRAHPAPDFAGISAAVLRSIAVFAVFCTTLFWIAATAVAEEGAAPPRNVIFMVADGMGLSNVTIARTYLFGPGGGRLSFETLPFIGYQRTASRNSFVTDSAAGASAWASGEKFNNGEVSCRDDDGNGKCDGTRMNRATLLEMAEAAGMATGLVATADITHATPAAWGAHVHDRNCETEIFRQMIENDIDVLLGGGIGANQTSCAVETPSGAEALVEQAKKSGYVRVSDRNALALTGGAPRLLGLFKPGGLTPAYQRPADSPEPTLAEMTRAALAVLEKNRRGFFLVVEGSQIDWANHSRNLEYQIHEVIGFHQAVEAVGDWMAQNPGRSNNTLLIVAADHETGGVIIEGPYGSLPQKGSAADMKVAFGSNAAVSGPNAYHTAVDTMVWSNHPACGKALENTDLFYIMKDYLGFKN